MIEQLVQRAPEPGLHGPTERLLHVYLLEISSNGWFAPAAELDRPPSGRTRAWYKRFSGFEGSRKGLQVASQPDCDSNVPRSVKESSFRRMRSGFLPERASAYVQARLNRHFCSARAFQVESDGLLSVLLRGRTARFDSPSVRTFKLWASSSSGNGPPDPLKDTMGLQLRIDSNPPRSTGRVTPCGERCLFQVRSSTDGAFRNRSKRIHTPDISGFPRRAIPPDLLGRHVGGRATANRPGSAAVPRVHFQGIPKSTTTGTPESAAMMTFLGFRSRWAIPWHGKRPEAICPQNSDSITVAEIHSGGFQQHPFNVFHDEISPGVIHGSDRPCVRISRANRSLLSSDAPACMHLMATIRFASRESARKTSPIPPCPMRSKTRYGPINRGNESCVEGTPG